MAQNIEMKVFKLKQFTFSETEYYCLSTYQPEGQLMCNIYNAIHYIVKLFWNRDGVGTN